MRTLRCGRCRQVIGEVDPEGRIVARHGADCVRVRPAPGVEMERDCRHCGEKNDLIALAASTVMVVTATA